MEKKKQTKRKSVKKPENIIPSLAKEASKQESTPVKEKRISAKQTPSTSIHPKIEYQEIKQEATIEYQETLGLHYKHERVKQKISVDMVAKKTNLRRRYIEAIENDAFDEIVSSMNGGDVYVRNFLRIYAQFLQLDYQKMMEHYEPQFIQKKTRSFIESPTALKNKEWSFTLIMIFLIIIFALGFGAYYYYFNISSEKTSWRLPNVTQFSQEESSFEEEQITAIDNIQPIEVIVKQEKPQKEAQQEKPQPKKEAQQEEQSEESKKKTLAALSSHSFVIMAVRSVKLFIVDADGVTVFEKILPKGASWVKPEDQLYFVTVEKPKNIEFFVHGKRYIYLQNTHQQKLTNVALEQSFLTERGYHLWSE